MWIEVIIGGREINFKAGLMHTDESHFPTPNTTLILNWTPVLHGNNLLNAIVSTSLSNGFQPIFQFGVGKHFGQCEQTFSVSRFLSRWIIAFCYEKKGPTIHAIVVLCALVTTKLGRNLEKKPPKKHNTISHCSSITPYLTTSLLLL